VWGANHARKDFAGGDPNVCLHPQIVESFRELNGLRHHSQPTRWVQESKLKNWMIKKNSKDI
jgi:hypothetical protein